MSQQDLYQRYQSVKNKENVYLIDIAQQLGVSEGELTAALPQSRYLGGDILAFLPELEALGEVMSLVRNPVAVHEKTGVYRNLDLSPMMGTAINLGGLDLRLFLRRWQHIFAVQENHRYSFRFFDGAGNAIQKVYLTDDKQIELWQALCARFACDETPVFEKQEAENASELTQLNAEQIAQYQQEWRNLKNVHHFRVVLSQFGIDRLQGLHYAPAGDACQLSCQAIEYLLQQCRARRITLLTFVNNHGMVQIQTGKVHHVTRARGWLNILDDKEEKFSLHLNDSEIAEFWFVRRPGSNGVVHSFEGYTADRNMVLQFFGRQADAEVEPDDWRELVQELLKQFQTA